MRKQILSIQNPLIKQIQSLIDKSRTRKQLGMFVIEGKRELSLAIKSDYTISTLLYYPELFSESEAKSLERYDIETIKISKEVFQKLAYRETTEGIIALAFSKELTLKALKFKNEHPLILVAEAPEKPGNIGALLRTADAAALDAVIIANPKTDMYNPNIIRSSVGCLFTNQIATANTAEVIAYLKAQQITMCAAALENATNYMSQDFKKASALIVGTEATGLSNEWLSETDKIIKIPMEGSIDSLNVSVAAAILIFEAKRQRS